ncbi:unnamed protein product [Moneuplotes crassus]|uniref:PH domain-containing protein n=1 Tax=Euplotes crassus TaxID=5936 RepID=A0AAD1UDM6_EUPCR|nr:unnamed protein product [Moneuplotes crassus]
MAKVHEHKIIYPDEDRPKITRKIQKELELNRSAKSLDNMEPSEKSNLSDMDEPDIQDVKIFQFDINIIRPYRTEIIRRKPWFSSDLLKSFIETNSEEEELGLPPIKACCQPGEMELTPLPEDSESWNDKVYKPRIEIPFNLNNKYSERTIVFKTLNRNRVNLFEGEIRRIRKRAGLFQVKKRFHITINNEGISLYQYRKGLDFEEDSPDRQFLFACEKFQVIQTTSQKFRIQIGKKSYHFEAREDITDWCRFINEQIQNKEDIGKTIQTKPWKSAHIVKDKFMKTSNTFDLFRFCDQGKKSFGIILKTHDSKAPKKSYYQYSPECCYYSHDTKRVCIKPIEKVPDHHDAFLIPLAGFKCDAETLSNAVGDISDLVKQSKIRKLSQLDFNHFLRDFYINIGVFTEISEKFPVKKTHFNNIFNSKAVEYADGCYFDNKLRIITSE